MPESVLAPNDRSARVGFAQNRLDRLSNLRDDAAAVEAMARDPLARTVVLIGDVPMLKHGRDGYDALFGLAEAEALGPLRERALLGRSADGPVFGTLLDARAADDQGHGGDHLAMDMRAIATQGLLPDDMVGILGQAKGLMYWHSRHRFCPNCGAATRVAAAGWRRECDGCSAQHFPRTDPVVIMLSVDGERALLGRQSRFPAKMYSCLAGFMEAGETVEDAVRREIGEEAGIATGRVSYLASQPWPFPASLMIGCLAQAATTDIVVDMLELEHARWFARSELVAMLAGTHPDGLACPPPMAIAHHLIRAWAIDGMTP